MIEPCNCDQALKLQKDLDECREVLSECLARENRWIIRMKKLEARLEEIHNRSKGVSGT